MTNKLLIGFGLVVSLLSGCSSTSGLYSAECASPTATEQFVYKGFNRSNLQGDNTLALTNKHTVVYYVIPTGSACRVTPMENNNNNE